MIELSASSSTHSKTRLTSNIAGQRLCFGQTGGSTGYTPLWYAYMTHNPGTSASYSASDSCLELAALLLLRQRLLLLLRGVTTVRSMDLSISAHSAAACS